MKKYYGLINHTKNHKVSSYWNNSPPSIKNIIQIATIFGWDKDDAILAGSYNDIYYYNIDKYGIVVCYLLEEDNEKSNIRITDHELLEDVYEYDVINFNDYDYDNTEIINSKYLKQVEFEDKCAKMPESINSTLLLFDNNKTLKQYDYNFKEMSSDFSRFPSWKNIETGKVDENTNYIFNENKFKKYNNLSNFDDAFFFEDFD
jgi:hypothetical protein